MLETWNPRVEVLAVNCELFVRNFNITHPCVNWELFSAFFFLEKLAKYGLISPVTHPIIKKVNVSCSFNLLEPFRTVLKRCAYTGGSGLREINIGVVCVVAWQDPDFATIVSLQELLLNNFKEPRRISLHVDVQNNAGIPFESLEYERRECRVWFYLSNFYAVVLSWSFVCTSQLIYAAKIDWGMNMLLRRDPTIICIWMRQGEGSLNDKVINHTILLFSFSNSGLDQTLLLENLHLESQWPSGSVGFLMVCNKFLARSCSGVPCCPFLLSLGASIELPYQHYCQWRVTKKADFWTGFPNSKHRPLLYNSELGTLSKPTWFQNFWTKCMAEAGL